MRHEADPRACVTDGQSASRLPEKAREDTRCVWFPRDRVMVSKRISVFPEFSCQHRVTAAVTQTNLYLHTQPLAFTCWWSPLLCTWLKTLACWHGARFSGETGGGSVAAFSLQPAATWWCTGTNSSEAACALQTSPPSATRLISYITKVGGKWKKKNPLRLEMIRWFVSHTFLTLPVIFSCCGCAAALFVAGNSSIQRNLPFPSLWMFVLLWW